MKTPLKLGEKVRIVRNLKELSQSYLAIKLNITQQAYQKLEQGKTIMTDSKLVEIAKILDVEEHIIREIDTFPIINTNINNYPSSRNQQEIFSNRLLIIQEEIKNIKGLIEMVILQQKEKY